MEHCRFHKGKRKALRSEPLTEYKNSNTFLSDYNAKCGRLVDQIDSELNKLYEQVTLEVVSLMKSCWDATMQSKGVPVAVVRCETLDGYDFEKALVTSLKVKPICIMPSNAISLYDLNELLRKMGEQKYVILKQVECILPGPFLEGLISVLSDPEWKMKIVLVMTVAVNFDAVFTQFSQESLWKMAIYCFSIPAPAHALEAICEAVALNPKGSIVIDGKLFEILQKRFLEENLSVCEVKRILKLTLLHKVLEGKRAENDTVAKCKNADVEPILLEFYETFLYLLHDLTPDFPNRARDVYELHYWIQSNPHFFTEKEGPFSTWKSIWITWDAEEMINGLSKLWGPVRKIAINQGNEIKKLMVDLREVHHRSTMMQEQMPTTSVTTPHCHEVHVAIESCCGHHNKKRFSLHEMQHRMRVKMEQRKRSDVLSYDRQRFVKLLCEIMPIMLKTFTQVPCLEQKLLVGRVDLLQMVVPSITADLERAFLHPKFRIKRPAETQIDLCHAYRSLLDLSLEYKNVPINRWLTKFKDYATDLKGVNMGLRLFRCISELEYMGMLKSSSERSSNKVNVLYSPCTITY